jgi:hypothetical protein
VTGDGGRRLRLQLAYAVGRRFVALLRTGYGPSRHFAASQQFGRFRSLAARKAKPETLFPAQLALAAAIEVVREHPL